MKRLLLFVLVVAANAQTITWTKVYTGPTTSPYGNFANGYEDIKYDPFSQRTIMYTTAASNSGNSIYSSRLHGFNSATNTDSKIGDNGQTPSVPCVAASDYWPHTHHAVSQMWLDTDLHKFWTLQGAGCTFIQPAQFYWSVSNPWPTCPNSTSPGTSGYSTTDAACRWHEVNPPNMPIVRNYGTPTTLSGGGSGVGTPLLNSDTQMYLTDPSSFADKDFAALASGEIVRVTTGGLRGSPGGVSGTNPVTIERGKFGTTASASLATGGNVYVVQGVEDSGAVVYIPDYKVALLFGATSRGGSFALGVYADTNGTGTLSAAQIQAGATNPDDWTNVTPFSRCTDAACAAFASPSASCSGLGTPCNGKVPPGYYYPNVEWDDVNHQVIVWGGSQGAPPGGKKTLLFTGTVNTTTHVWTWTNKAPSCTGSDCVSGAPVPHNPGVEDTRVAHAMRNGKFYYHSSLNCTITGGSAPTQDWVYDPVANTWTEIQTNASGAAPNYTEAMTYDSDRDLFIVKATTASGTCTGGNAAYDEIWVGTLAIAPTITTTTLNAGAQYKAFSQQLVATGSTASWTYTGTLPTGITLSSSGLLSGTTRQPGTYSINATATNPAGNTSQAYTFTVTASLGIGESTYNCVDVDGDGYGVGSCLGPDADDTDYQVHTTAAALSKWSTLQALWAHLGATTSIDAGTGAYNGTAWTPNFVFYVDPAATGGSCTKVGPPFTYDATKACTTADAAYSAMVAGESIVYRSGAYGTRSTNLFFKSGTLSGTTCVQPTYFLSYPGETAELIWSAGQATLVGGTQSCFVLDGIKFTQQNLGTGKVFSVSADICMYGWNISHVETQGWTDGLFPQSCLHGPQITHNYIHDSRSAGGDGHGIYYGSRDVSSGDGVIRGNIFARHEETCVHLNGYLNNVLIDSNLIYGCNKGIHVEGQLQNSTIQNNVIHTVASKAIELHEYGTQTYPPGYPGQCGSITGNIFRNNAIFQDGKTFDSSVITNGNGGQPAIHIADDASCLAWGYPSSSITGNTWVNNIIQKSCGGATCRDSSGTTGVGVAGPVIAYGGPKYSDQAQTITASPATWQTYLQGDTWTNNIIYNVDQSSRIFASTTWTYSGSASSQAAYTYQNCAWFTNTANNPNFTGSSLCGIDPQFSATNPAWGALPQLWDMRVQPGSSALAAAASNIPTFDILGAVRGASATLGAYEAAGPASVPATRITGRVTGSTR
jgi:hypothetical protein